LADLNNVQSNKPGVTVDSLFAGKLICHQPQQGYRFSIDAVLLAHFCKVQRGDSILDLGCGCGIIGLILLFRWRTLLSYLTGLEIQPELAELARSNGLFNGFEYTIIEGDLRNILDYFQAESFSRVVCNPPFYKSATGRKNTDRQSSIARHQIYASTDQVMSAAATVVKNRGWVSVVFPAEGAGELICAMNTVRLQPKRMQMVYGYPDRRMNARLVLIEALKNGGPGVRILPPFYIYQKKNGSYSEEMQKLYDLEWENQYR
jgi:tRNA1Val (adenine37-N6)-methyltransferase